MRKSYIHVPMTLKYCFDLKGIRIFQIFFRLVNRIFILKVRFAIP